jgi:hypothetical protein
LDKETLAIVIAVVIGLADIAVTVILDLVP